MLRRLERSSPGVEPQPSITQGLGPANRIYYIYAFWAARYWMLAPPLLAVFLLLAFLALRRGKTKAET